MEQRQGFGSCQVFNVCCAYITDHVRGTVNDRNACQRFRAHQLECFGKCSVTTGTILEQHYILELPTYLIEIA
jgi:hypothetical protein